VINNTSAKTIISNPENTIGMRLTLNTEECASRLCGLNELLFSKIESIIIQTGEEVASEAKRDRFPDFFERIQVQIDRMNNTMTNIEQIIHRIQL
jgi:hypothetical protein